MPRFVLLYHDCPPSYQRPCHWDLMLESGDILRTWALERLPRDWKTAHALTQQRYPECAALAVSNTVAAIALGDHRRDYLEFEGPLTNNRGDVVRVEAGMYGSEDESADYWRVTVTGKELKGMIILARSSSDHLKWSLEYLPTA